MLLIRSWPADPPPRHACCEDQIRRVLTAPFDYAPLCALGDDVLHLDWDIAVSPEDLATFAASARRQPGQVLVGPYRTYPGSLFGADPVPRELPGPVWTAKVYADDREWSMHYVQPGDPVAHLFGFGMVYLPAGLLARWAEQFPGAKMGDMEFSGWHYRIAGPARICWAVHPVHLNYPPPVEL